MSALSILAYTFVAFSLSPVLTAIAVTLGGILMFVMRGQHRRSQALGRLTSDANKQVQQVIEEGLAGLKLTKILGNESRHSRLMQDIRTNLRERNLRFVKLNAATGLTFQLLIAVFIVMFLYLGAQTLALPMSTLLILIVIFARLAPQLRQVQTHLNHISYSKAAFDNYSDLIRSTEHVSEALIESTDCTPLLFSKAIRLHGVSYTYKERSRAALRNISVDIPFQKTTAIMGASGSGKSTLADIIIGLLSPDAGEILVDDRILSQENRVAWRRCVAYVAQDVFLFHDTIRNNLLWADAMATEKELRTALEKASANFVFALPDGLDTIVGDIIARGVTHDGKGLNIAGEYISRGIRGRLEEELTRELGWKSELAIDGRIRSKQSNNSTRKW